MKRPDPSDDKYSNNFDLFEADVKKFDERQKQDVKTPLKGGSTLEQLRDDVTRLTTRIEALEARMGEDDHK